MLSKESTARVLETSAEGPAAGQGSNVIPVAFQRASEDTREASPVTLIRDSSGWLACTPFMP